MFDGIQAMLPLQAPDRQPEASVRLKPHSHAHGLLHCPQSCSVTHQKAQVTQTVILSMRTRCKGTPTLPLLLRKAQSQFPRIAKPSSEKRTSGRRNGSGPDKRCALAIMATAFEFLIVKLELYSVCRSHHIRLHAHRLCNARHAMSSCDAYKVQCRMICRERGPHKA